jgi:hypothetical protein
MASDKLVKENLLNSDIHLDLGLVHPVALVYNEKWIV